MSSETTPRRKRPLRGKVCSWCDQNLEAAAKGHCGAIYRDLDWRCWWVTNIRQFGAEKALAMSTEEGADARS
jgi:hypothetical protein